MCRLVKLVPRLLEGLWLDLLFFFLKVIWHRIRGIEVSRFVSCGYFKSILNKTEGQILLLHFNQLKNESLFALYLNSVTPPTSHHSVFICSMKPPTNLLTSALFFCLSILSVNFHISQSCSFWETLSCCHLHTVSPDFFSIITQS